MERNLSIDEQLVLFKGTLSIKQCIKENPFPCEIMVFVVAESRSVIFEFIAHYGSNTKTN